MFASLFRKKMNVGRPTARLGVETLEERSLPSASPFPVSASIAVTGADWPPPPATQVHVSLMTKSTGTLIQNAEWPPPPSSPQLCGSIGEEIPTAHDPMVGHVELFAQRDIGEEIPQ